jgi:hypothetical protein
MMIFQAAEGRKPPAGPLTDTERVALFNSLIAYAGTYKVNGSNVSIHMEANIVPGAADRTYKMEINGKDELKYTNPATATGTKAEAVWKRMK